MRKQIIRNTPRAELRAAGELDVTALATAIVTSESPAHPIENAFDAQRGPGGSRWVASEAGEQSVTLAFDAPQVVREVSIEIEETEHARTQELALSISQDGGKTTRELLRQEFNFSPAGATFQRETWAVNAGAITHLCVRIVPNKGGGDTRASLTALVLR